MKLLVSGSSRGIGLAVSCFFLAKGYEVVGLDLLPSNLTHPNYTHYICDVSDKSSLPSLSDIDYIFNNAGKMNSEDDIKNNLYGAINVTEKYGLNPYIKSILFNASASAQRGDEFPLYVASKAGIVGYMKNIAIEIAKYGATCNSISLGGVLTESNAPVTTNPKYWDKIMEVTPLKKWMSLEEVAEWVYFLLIKNKSMSGQDLLIDNGEEFLNSTFVWPEPLR